MYPSLSLKKATKDITYQNDIARDISMSLKKETTHRICTMIKTLYVKLMILNWVCSQVMTNGTCMAQQERHLKFMLNTFQMGGNYEHHKKNSLME